MGLKYRILAMRARLDQLPQAVSEEIYLLGPQGREFTAIEFDCFS